ncbi:sensor histidine kinase [Ramlibacter rhizophilus]|uniref:histidine kinase n=1 Tax=Ramlibacter rhizophilus TaxID=1781167 RepID=A0A4Z0BYA2_9BURK|nr:ATP-binding protein [Ramlibacter rhizophilus]TFZ03278.1 DUF4118 domain-containing protein [Ramlibacter rhizophilus]
MDKPVTPPARALPSQARPDAAAPARALPGALRALGVVAACTALSELIASRLDLANIIMVYLAGVVYVALREPVRIALGTVVASTFLFNLLFVPPRWGLNPLNTSHFFTFAVMLGVGFMISRLAEQARQQRRLAEQAETERFRSTLLAGISHDLRTPLTTIVGTATSLLEQGDRLDRAQHELLLRGLLEQAQRLHRQMTDLLDLARMEEGAVQLQPEWCPADDLVAEALAPLAARLQGRRLDTTLAADAIVWCDPRLMEQALFNLVDNALRYTPAEARIRIEVRLQPGVCQFVVADEGPGLPEGREQELFRKFQRGQSEPAGGGFGLGLAICAAVARLHQGGIQAENDAGARFMLNLPQPARPDLGDD